jgi:hypothetical protein
MLGDFILLGQVWYILAIIFQSCFINSQVNSLHKQFLFQIDQHALKHAAVSWYLVIKMFWNRQFSGKMCSYKYYWFANDPQIQAIKLAKKFNRWQEWEIKTVKSIFVSGRNRIQFDSI